MNLLIILLVLIILVLKLDSLEQQKAYTEWNEWSKECTRDCSERYGFQTRSKISLDCNDLGCVLVNEIKEKKLCYNGK